MVHQKSQRPTMMTRKRRRNSVCHVLWALCLSTSYWGKNGVAMAQVTCQISMADTFLEDGNTSGSERLEDSIICIPGNDQGVQWDDYYPIPQLPSNIWQQNQEKLYQARLFVHIPEATIDSTQKGLMIPQTATFQVVPKPSGKRMEHNQRQRGIRGAGDRSLGDDDDDDAPQIRTMGDFSLVLIRVSTRDSTPTVSADD